jgi:hypothetical protein
VTANGLSGPRLNVLSSGAGKIATAGRVTDQRVTLTGAGSYDGANLDSENADIQISGLGSAVVRANSTLDVSISGTGSVEYIGNPQVSRQISGAGTVSQRRP